MEISTFSTGMVVPTNSGSSKKLLLAAALFSTKSLIRLQEEFWMEMDMYVYSSREIQIVPLLVYFNLTV